MALAEEAPAGERFENMTERVPSGGKAVLALSALVMIWGYNWVVMKVALQYSSPFDYAALRVLLGGISLFLVLVWLRKPLLPKEVSGTFLAGCLQTSGFYGLSTLALVSGGAGKTAVLNYAMPFWVVLLAWFVLGEQLQKVQLFGVAIALAGFTLHSHALQPCGGTIQQGARPFIEHELGDRHHCFEEAPAERRM